MPPLGFNKTHSQNISSFFSNCLRGLIRDGQAAQLKPIGAVVRGIQNIDAHLRRNECSPVVVATLQLTRAFYVELTKHKALTYDELKGIGVLAIKDLRLDIEAVKVKELTTA